VIPKEALRGDRLEQEEKEKRVNEKKNVKKKRGSAGAKGTRHNGPRGGWEYERIRKKKQNRSGRKQRPRRKKLRQGIQGNTSEALKVSSQAMGPLIVGRTCNAPSRFCRHGGKGGGDTRRMPKKHVPLVDGWVAKMSAGNGH